VPKAAVVQRPVLPLPDKPHYLSAVEGSEGAHDPDRLTSSGCQLVAKFFFRSWLVKRKCRQTIDLTAFYLVAGVRFIEARTSQLRKHV
jgi:hypothetical protein